MQFSDTTNKNGLIQEVEFWTNLGDGAISGDTTLLKRITSQINSAFEDLMPTLLSYTPNVRWDDYNNTDYPIGTLNMVSGQNDYTIAADSNSYAILNFNSVQILQSAGATEYTTLQEMTMDDPRAEFAMSPGTADVGIPTHFLEKGTTFFLYPNPNVSITNGIKVFFERQQNYFASTDTTKEPGIPKPMHRLLAFIASRNYIAVNKSDNLELLKVLNDKITVGMQNLFDIISARTPTHSRMMPNTSSGNSYNDLNSTQ